MHYSSHSYAGKRSPFKKSMVHINNIIKYQSFFNPLGTSSDYLPPKGFLEAPSYFLHLFFRPIHKILSPASPSSVPSSLLPSLVNPRISPALQFSPPDFSATVCPMPLPSRTNPRAFFTPPCQATSASFPAPVATRPKTFDSTPSILSTAYFSTSLPQPPPSPSHELFIIIPQPPASPSGSSKAAFASPSPAPDLPIRMFPLLSQLTILTTPRCVFF